MFPWTLGVSCCGYLPVIVLETIDGHRESIRKKKLHSEKINPPPRSLGVSGLDYLRLRFSLMTFVRQFFETIYILIDQTLEFPSPYL